MKLCHVGRDIARTGGGEVLRPLAKRMSAVGDEVIIVTDTAKSQLAELTDAGVEVRNTPFGVLLLAWTPRTRVGWHVRHALQILVFTVAGTLASRALRRSGYLVINHNCEILDGDMVVMHNVFGAELRRRNLGRRGTARALLNPTRLMRLLKEQALARSGKRRTFVAVSHAGLADVVGLVGARHRVEVVANAIDVERFRIPGHAAREAQRTLLGLGASDVAIAFVGHEFKRKGLPELLESVAHLPPNYHLFVGGGASQNMLAYQKTCERLKIAARVRFLGDLRDPAWLFGASDIFCLPSHYETMGLVALESLACGTPVVLSSNCPVGEIIVPGRNGTICAVEPASIAEAILRATALRVDREDVRGTVLQRSWTTAAIQYRALCASL